MNSCVRLSLSLMLAAGLIGGCAAPPPPPPTPLPPTSVPTVTSTSEPPTVTPSPRPTATVTPSGPPTPTTQPAIDATRPKDVIGTWLVHYAAGLGMGKIDVRWTFNPDGTYVVETVKNKDPWGDGAYHFQDGKLYFENQRCMNTRGDILPCTGIYTVRSTYRGEVPVLLKFKLVEDKLDRERAVSLDGVVVGLAAP